ncbi:hypothetical protein [Pseudonocardia asaccharolytica]|uniref:Major facilitator superfamily (MFS) profile domain-containing protein n=1 Tax=Pseudonocardia asaccharolytica DSM 44247 = NBRC 16224 TaxID=1123024 RepID=A0A511D464_9PSEU|nr:hypothetical protein [Pseudonocardia asaccharolytica]GEL19565.1 hypothetical protein PA7_34020 [Pseudonocardia asaccharolytica DSM 44247 = NBRC 16224]
MALQIYTLTGSSLAVGGIGLAMAVPAIAVGLLGGTLIDAVDRRRLVLATRSRKPCSASADRRGLLPREPPARPRLGSVGRAMGTSAAPETIAVPAG